MPKKKSQYYQILDNISKLQSFFILFENQLKSRNVTLTIIYSKQNMNSPIYPLYITNIQLSNPQFSHFFNTTNNQNQTFFTQPLTYSAAILYPSLPNCILSACPIYPTSLNLVENRSEPQSSCNSQEGRFGNGLFFSSTKCFEADKECKIEANISSDLVKRQQVNSWTQNLLSQKLNIKKQRKNKTKIRDTDYVPNRSDKKEPRRRFNENQNRNVIPNQINQILSFLHKKAKSEALLKRVWAKYPPPSQEYSISRFYLLQNHLKEKVGHYSNEASLKLLKSLIEPECNIWSQSQQRHYIMLSRVLIGHFLREDSIFAILTSKRMKSDKKLEHLRTRRVVTCIVKQLLKD